MIKQYLLTLNYFACAGLRSNDDVFECLKRLYLDCGNAQISEIGASVGDARVATLVAHPAYDFPPRRGLLLLSCRSSISSLAVNASLHTWVLAASLCIFRSYLNIIYDFHVPDMASIELVRSTERSFNVEQRSNTSMAV